MSTKFSAFTLLTVVFCLVGCGSATSQVCERAAECDIIGNEDLAECESDLERAIEDEVVSKDRVKKCRDCLDENSCGIDIVLDCASACDGVSGIVFASNIN